MFVLDDRFLTMCAFLTGFGLGRQDDVDDAFRQWLADRQAEYKNFGAPPMVLAEAGIRPMGSSSRPLSDVEHAHAIATLWDLLIEFLEQMDTA